MNKLFIQRVLLLVSALGFLAGCVPNFKSSAPDEQPDIVKINGSLTISSAPLYFAVAEGYFEDVNIQLEFVTFNRSSEAIPLIATGDLDAYASSMNSGLFNLLAQEEGVKTVADRSHISPQDECVYFGMAFREDLINNGELTGPEDFAGKSINYREGGVGDYVLRTYLEQGGISLEDMILVSVPTDSIVQAWEAESMDIAHTSQPRLTQVVDVGNAVISVNDADVVGNLQLAALVFGKRLTTDDRDLGIRFLQAYLRGLRQYAEGKTDRNVEVLAEYLGDTEENIRNACWPTISSDGWIDFEGSVNGFQMWALEAGYLDNAISEDQYWDPSLLQAAQDALGD